MQWKAMDGWESKLMGRLAGPAPLPLHMDGWSRWGICQVKLGMRRGKVGSCQGSPGPPST